SPPRTRTAFANGGTSKSIAAPGSTDDDWNRVRVRGDVRAPLPTDAKAPTRTAGGDSEVERFASYSAVMRIELAGSVNTTPPTPKSISASASASPAPHWTSATHAAALTWPALIAGGPISVTQMTCAISSLHWRSRTSCDPPTLSSTVRPGFLSYLP